MRIVTTPLALQVPLPANSRQGGVDRALFPALVDAPGVDAIKTRLSDSRTLVITTGQQPGLFLGPLYTLYKALSAAALAALLESRWNRPVVPVFWAANDDHDYAEAQWASWLDASGEVRTGVATRSPRGCAADSDGAAAVAPGSGRTPRRARARSSTGPGPGLHHRAAPAVLPRRHHARRRILGRPRRMARPTRDRLPRQRASRGQGDDGATAGRGGRPREGARRAAHRAGPRSWNRGERR